MNFANSRILLSTVLLTALLSGCGGSSSNTGDDLLDDQTDTDGSGTDTSGTDTGSETGTDTSDTDTGSETGADTTGTDTGSETGTDTSGTDTGSETGTDTSDTDTGSETGIGDGLLDDQTDSDGSGTDTSDTDTDDENGTDTSDTDTDDEAGSDTSDTDTDDEAGTDTSDTDTDDEAGTDTSDTDTDDESGTDTSDTDTDDGTDTDTSDTDTDDGIGTDGSGSDDTADETGSDTGSGTDNPSTGNVDMLIPVVEAGSDLESLLNALHQHVGNTLLDLNQRLNSGIELTDQQEICLGAYDPAAGEQLTAISCETALAIDDIPLHLNEAAFYDTDSCHVSLSAGNTTSCQLQSASLVVDVEWAVPPGESRPAPVFPGALVEYAINDTMLRIDNDSDAVSGYFSCSVDLVTGETSSTDSASCDSTLATTADRLDTVLQD